MGQIFGFALTAALNPTLLAATTVMLVLPSPKRLLLGYLLGALMTSITLGLLIVFSLNGSSSGTSTAKHTLNPVVDIVLGALALVIAFVVATGRDTRRRARSERKKAAKADKAPPKWQQKLSGGTARTTFVIGAVLTLPGASYLAALATTAKQDLTTVETVLTIIAVNVVMLVLLEVPLVGYTLAPETTAVRVKRFNDWLSRDGGKIALGLVVLVGLALVGRGVAELFSS
jgi:small-conductance mechanosensitive channel